MKKFEPKAEEAVGRKATKAREREPYQAPGIVWEEEFEPLVYAASVACAKFPGSGDVCDVQPSTT